MDYFTVLSSIILYVEARLEDSRLDYTGLERAIGFSLPHIRDVFASHIGVSLSRYVLRRKIANAAFALIHSSRRITDIGAQYGFASPDTFSRAFKRVTGLTPQEFRRQRRPVGRVKLCAGVYGAGLLPANHVQQEES